MKITKKTRPKKLSLSGGILLVIGLYCSAIQAESKMQDKANIVNNYAYPSITSEVFNRHNQIAIQSTTQISRKPSLGIKVTDFANLVPHKFAKNNSLFEFAAKFNDKLQQVLAYFDFLSTSTNSKNKNISENNAKQKSSLVAKNDNKVLKANARVSKK
ncbi:hypothetical protein H4J46_02740 [Colwellia sp. MB02u-6]|jgi:hypothetical protein|uniref:hypothetical protein n=1 Tax=Colwellia sp. MB02u-6 TaxID=2759824 RepID=UPI0015F375B7|nr:hypothetical protein [Colwellia sp. MB02u-6]MBA6326871.1 hypothetical protein [Colwellia sp. MB02u-6]